MSSSAPSPRPKVHRLPPAPAPKPVRVLSRRHPVVLWGASLALLIALSVAVENLAYHFHKSNILASLSPSTGGAPEASSLGLSPPISDAQASTGLGKTIILQAQSETIIGQMAKIPYESEPITEIRPVSEIDNSMGRELLSILSKY